MREAVTGVIVAGGLGTRLRSAVGGTPKCLAPVNGEPFLFQLLRQIKDAGVGRILLCTGYGADQVERCVGTSFSGIPIVYSREDQPLGTGGALKLAHERYGSDDSWLVMNGDSYLELDFASFRQAWARSGCDAGIAAAQVPDGRRFGALQCSGDWRVLAFDEKSSELGAKWINGGVYFLNTSFLAALPETAPLSLEREVFTNWIPKGLMAYPARGRFIDIGIPESFAEAQTFFAGAAAR